MSSEPNNASNPEIEKTVAMARAITDHFSAAAKQELQTLSARHVNINIAFAVLATLVMALMLFAGVHSLKSFDAKLAVADQRYVEYQKDKEQNQKVLDGLNQQISSLQTQIDRKQQAIVVRDKQAAQTTAQITAPSEASMDVVQDTNRLYGFYPTLDSRDMTPCLACTPLFEFTKEEVQTFNATKVDRDRLAGDLTDTQSQFATSTQIAADQLKKSTILEGEKTKCEADLKQYRDAAHKGKFRKFLDGAEKVGLTIGGTAVGWLIRGAL